jgi:hypothetical protein
MKLAAGRPQDLADLARLRFDMTVDMSPHAIEMRLVAAADESDLRLLGSSLRTVDMSPAAIEHRLRECAELSAICDELVRAGSR